MINAIRFVRQLEETGFDKNQSEEIVNVINESLNHNFATKEDLSELRFATKHDLNELRTELKHEINELRTEFKQEINKLRLEISELRSELKQDISELRSEFKQDMLKLENRLLLKLGIMMGASMTLMTSVLVLILK